MAMPSRDLGDLLVADWAQTPLLFPQMNEPLFPLKGVYYFYVQAFFIVAFPLKIVRVGLSSYLDMPFDRHVCSVCEILRLLFSGSVEYPIVFADGSEVFLRNPRIGFLWVASFGPLFYHTIDRVIHGCEGLFTHDVLMIERPSPDDGVELCNQFPCT